VKINGPQGCSGLGITISHIAGQRLPDAESRLDWSLFDFISPHLIGIEQNIFWRSAMRLVRSVGAILVLATWCANTQPVGAIQIVVDYRYDTQNFFNPSTNDGQNARSTVEAAADWFSAILDDTLSAIPFVDPNPTGPNLTPVWRQIFKHPGTGQLDYIVSSAADASMDGLTVYQSQPAADEFRDIQIPADQILVYVGGSSLDSALGEASTGFSVYGQPSFNTNVAQRGKPTSEFSTWGGSITFDNDAATNWNFDYLVEPAVGKSDLYSVALHEIGHLLGLASNNSPFNTWVVGTEFRGPQALDAWKREDPSAPSSATGIPLEGFPSGGGPLDRHWKDNAPLPTSAPSVSGFRVGTTKRQEAAMDPNILTGTRKLFTDVDTYALRDIGWTILDSVFAIPGDFNGDGDVDGSDLAYWNTWYGINANADADGDGDTDGDDFLIWQRNYTGSLPFSAVSAVPEPAVLTLVACAMLCCRRRRS
jgi:Matrixin